jgi:murein DD-endopeptidase MepM/ murein hydrolase activator NlpD
LKLTFRQRLETIGATAVLTSAMWIVGLIAWPKGSLDLAAHADPRAAAAPIGVDAGATPGMIAAAEARGSAAGPPPMSASAGPLIVPVQGVRVDQLVDTYTQSRGGGMRVHNAIDIMAPRGTRVVAAASGVVEKLFLSKNGGITIYVRSPDRRTIYYYAHLDRYAPGLAERQQVRAGELIGFVGSTGDASPDAPHLHFAINVMQPDEGWWQGQPINPYPLLLRR